ncbi:MAG: DUF3467 domain-containing protein [Methanoregula sp.]
MKPDEIKVSGQHPPGKNEKFLLDVGRMYEFKPEDMTPEIKTSAYSNVAYITCSNRDIFIDFLEIPGIKREGKMMVSGTRIYMSHAAAQQLAVRLGQVLEGSCQRGEMESYTPQSSPLPVRMKDQKKKW